MPSWFLFCVCIRSAIFNYPKTCYKQGWVDFVLFQKAGERNTEEESTRRHLGINSWPIRAVPQWNELSCGWCSPRSGSGEEGLVPTSAGHWDWGSCTYAEHGQRKWPLLSGQVFTSPWHMFLSISLFLVPTRRYFIVFSRFDKIPYGTGMMPERFTETMASPTWSMSFSSTPPHSSSQATG